MTPHTPGFFCGLKKAQDMLKRKLVLSLLILPFLINGPVLAKNEDNISKPKIEAKQVDNRAKVAAAYLAKYNSPLQYQAQDFIEAADTQDMDWRLLVAIAGVESTFGKFIPGDSYNAWGWGVYGDQAIYFKSWREGIFTVSEGLKKNYISKGLNNPAEINRIYSSSSAWGGHVDYFLNDIKNFEAGYNSGLNTEEIVFNAPTAGTSGVLALK